MPDVPSKENESTLTIDTRGRALVRRAQLRVVDGEDMGAIHATDATRMRIVVGTASSVDLVLRDPTVSRFQLEIELGESGVVCRRRPSNVKIVVRELRKLDPSNP